MNNNKIYINELVNRIKTVNPEKIILFGSNANNNSSAGSDIDIIVVLNKIGYSVSYKEMLGNKQLVSQKIIDIRKKYRSTCLYIQ